MPYTGYQEKAYHARQHGPGNAMPCEPGADEVLVNLMTLGLHKDHPDWSAARCYQRAIVEALKYDPPAVLHTRGMT